ncbi:hypothetical protein [Bradyrhizobium sp. USDA 329]|uniref:DUF6953 family protein n=1 Tax=unclassified Bradyrhizobium TaxID=2631580 RepID=UPI0035112885
MTTPSEVAQFMLDELKRVSFLYQEQVVHDIQQKFGDDFVYLNENGNYAISKKVLTVFRQLAPDVVWERGERMWRERTAYDTDGRQQD